MGRTGVELISYDGSLAMQNAFTRGNCEYGIMPANGLIYVPPHSCGCYIQIKVSGFFAYSPKNKSPLAGQTPKNVLVKGKAFEDIDPSRERVSQNDWSTYRHDALRSGSCSSNVSAEIKPLWKTKLSGEVSSPVIADGTVYLAAEDAHTLYAVDQDSGETRWTFRAGARIDSPPTVVGNVVYFGSRDGWVYALLAETGELAWKFRAAKSDRMHCVYGQLESVWPVHGSVLALDGSIYFAAGKSSYLDDGLYLYQLNARTGQKLMEKKFYSRDPVTGDQVPNAGHNLPGGLNDILASDGQTLFMRDFQLHLDSIPDKHTIMGKLPEKMKPHVHNTAGYLDETWAHRTYWYYGTKMDSAYGGWARAGRRNYSGRLMVRDGDQLYGYGRRKRDNDFRAAPALGFYGIRDTHLFCAPAKVPSKSTSGKRNKRAAANLQYTWSIPCELHVRAMALAGDKVLVAGTKDILRTENMTRSVIGRQAELLESDKGQYFQVYSKKNGNLLAEVELNAKPAFDGKAVAEGKVFISTESGELICLGPSK
jgi:outer membrane protein assembly factor BamB